MSPIPVAFYPFNSPDLIFLSKLRRSGSILDRLSAFICCCVICVFIFSIYSSSESSGDILFLEVGVLLFDVLRSPLLFIAKPRHASPLDRGMSYKLVRSSRASSLDHLINILHYIVQDNSYFRSYLNYSTSFYILFNRFSVIRNYLHISIIHTFPVWGSSQGQYC